MNVIWIKKIDTLPPSLQEDLKKRNKYDEKYYGVLGTIIGETLKINDRFYTDKIQIGIPHEFIVIGIYGSKENETKNVNVLSYTALAGSTVLVIAQGVSFTTPKHTKEIETAILQRDAAYYGPLSLRDLKENQYSI